MAVSEEFKNAVLSYCKIEDDDKDVTGLIEAAVQKMEIETGKVFDETKPLCCLIVEMLVEDWYDHRGSVTTENLHELPPTIGAQVILNQIGLSAEFESKKYPGGDDESQST